MNNHYNFRIGHGYDVHALKEGLPMYLGGVKIEEAKSGFVAHSDGDVALHALCDALLGALALRDIGYHFPNTATEWENADSKLLLKKVMTLITESGWAVGNIDITIALERPKLSKYVDKMQECIANLSYCTKDCVSIKAGTTERLGFVGRGEGCEVWAVVLIHKA